MYGGFSSYQILVQFVIQVQFNVNVIHSLGQTHTYVVARKEYNLEKPGMRLINNT